MNYSSKMEEELDEENTDQSYLVTPSTEETYAFYLNYYHNI